MKVVRLSALPTSRLYPQEVFVVLISVRGWVNFRAIVRPERLCQWKIPLTRNSVSTFIVPCLCEAQHVSGDTPPIIRSPKLHYQPLVLHTWKVVWCWGCWTLSASSNLNIKQPLTYAKAEADSAVLGSWWWAAYRPKHVELHINME